MLLLLLVCLLPHEQPTATTATSTPTTRASLTIIFLQTILNSFVRIQEPAGSSHVRCTSHACPGCVALAHDQDSAASLSGFSHARITAKAPCLSEISPQDHHDSQMHLIPHAHRGSESSPRRWGKDRMIKRMEADSGAGGLEAARRTLVTQWQPRRSHPLSQLGACQAEPDSGRKD